MRTINIHQAKTQLSRLVDEAVQGTGEAATGLYEGDVHPSGQLLGGG